MNAVIGRRALLRGAAVAAAAGALPLAGCTTTKSPSTTAASGNKVKLPTYVAQTAVKYDLPAGPNGAPPPVLFTYPQNPPSATKGTPAKGGSIEILSSTDAVPPPVGKNTMWQTLNKELGAELKFDWSVGGYAQKFATALAGGELREISVIDAYETPHLPQVLEAKFEDLTPFLAGDKVKAYPNLANNPTDTWRMSVFAGKIYSVPAYQWPNSVFNMMIIRSDLAKAKGVDPQPKSGEEFLSLCKEFADPARNQWVLALPGTTLSFVLACLGAPNRWRVGKDGKWTRDYETPEYKQALGIVADLWKKQYFHPDSFSPTFDDSVPFCTGKIVMEQGFPGIWGWYMQNKKKQYPDLEIAPVRPFKWGGGGTAGTFQNADRPNSAGIRKGTSPARVKELLRVLDWLSAPVGSKEYLLAAYGVEGVDYNMTKEGPVMTERGNNESNIRVQSFAGPPQVLNLAPGPGVHDALVGMHDYFKATGPTSVPNPGLVLYSDADSSKGATLTTNMTNLANDIIQGHQPISAWADGVKTWRSNGGDQIRKEYEKSYAAEH
ncbi:putative aldouronate transport system substrate-binding protein [Actinopolymorpha cephalotaxi]|uniref:Aldouronate transport system substrate-binding protein n=1 Tax=Actinopolymorpha cephalotaxi TaxID=504797 RepID=A0A1I2ZXU4_9ACTN|nr:extracellular solute-binding protein [Actinopolymorpha cephalotaxi]NYH84223.1 putative aldouronate transport system substrate-binding protein [Actinopolymorpha cephalotaxi]SFH42475.1 putative aldouronate transport system substrate-binding protein [Actinopolymorpha cephalotaxi]